MWLWLTACNQWLRTTLAWSNSWQSWRERLGVGVLALAALVLAWFGRRLSVAQQVVLWGMLIVALAAMLRRGWLKLFGPVLFYDLVRVGRRSRYILFRALYVSFLLAVLGWIWLMQTLSYEYRMGGNQIKMMAEFAEYLFFTFMTVQLVLTFILTPGYVAGCIAKEKDRQTLEFLLATDLRNREIVLSKLVSRLANLLLIVLAGLPVLSFLQFFGGIDPDLLLASFAATGLIMMSLSGVSILASVHCRKPRDAIVLTYLIVVAYEALSLMAFGLMEFLKIDYPAIANWGLELDKVPWSNQPFAFTLEDLTNVFNAGDLVLALGKLMNDIRNTPLSDMLPGMLLNFAIFHGAIALFCSALAVIRVRRVALKEAFGKTARLPLTWRLLGRPQIGDQPMLWKEIFSDPGLRLKWMGKLAIGTLVLLSFVPVGIIIAQVFASSRPMWRVPWEELGEMMNAYVRIVGTIVACLALLAVAVRAAGSLSGERDKQTFDGLLTTPLDATTILFAKWVGSIVSIRWAWLWLALIWTLGAAMNGLQVVAIPFIILSWVVYAGVFACIGMWFSLVCKTTLRSTMWTLLTTVFLGGGHWVMTGMCCFMPLALSRSFGNHDAEYLVKFLAGQTPPAVLFIFSIHGREFTNNYMWNDFAEFLGFSILGLGSWTVGGLILGTVLQHRFQEMTLRQPFRRPERFVLAARPVPPAPQLEAPPPTTRADPDDLLPEVLPVEDGDGSAIEGQIHRVGPDAPGSDGN